MANNSSGESPDEENQELNDLFIDPITGEIQAPNDTGQEPADSFEEDYTGDGTVNLAGIDPEAVGEVFATADVHSETDSEDPAPLPSIPHPDDFHTESAEREPEADSEIDFSSSLLEGSEQLEEAATEFPEENIEAVKQTISAEAEAVDDYLESAVLASGSESLAGDLEEQSTEKSDFLASGEPPPLFQVSLRSASNPKTQAHILRFVEREKFVDDLSGFKKSLQELGGYRFSQLDEFQATMLMQELHKLDVEYRLDLPAYDGDVSFPDRAAGVFHNSEEVVQSTGAIAVELPKNSREILLSTVEQIAGHEITEEKGILSAHSSVARSFFRADEQEARLEQKIDHLRPNASAAKTLRLPRAEMDQVFERLLQRIQREAMRRGANAVIGIQISGFPEANSIDPEADQIRLIATGTAVVLQSS